MPAAMKCIKKCNRNIHRYPVYIIQLSPTFFIIGFDGGFILSKRQFKTHVGVHVTIGHMVYQLLDRPSTFSVRLIELMFIEVFNGSFQQGRKELNILQPFSFLFRRKWLWLIFTNGITGIGAERMHSKS